ncbi:MULTISPECIES: GDSL-type esterase/lipase family protein [unclassified Mucilaginibacter]|uniref:GDSL-type esterase/lipase family protein n=1 Tax=unclassified Mucilaginibacter TaxID=2617802 RepID=UPI002AC9363D|nr:MULTISPECIES: GDSL-type esterase/lipase family protein [unclassified Mucilaginibacter]MEB0262447.1 GDSL-type esterase/lipase family protein [Mucilaginibacter sp. 10I4]MEB0279272.1 GDSL-type esterase/lipase family protein [Mucilaginibacter sp. 10B2]MEB0302590.1 GDSL-type esterase/lipase family protein [Mucilaginibacter sp. 5C4]WPX23216.1 GDSL-type esterase/lipase family protein [Mucilaginibacter sp. 5C4]
MKIRIILLLVLATFGLAAHAQTGFPFDNEIRDFKHQDSLKMPAKNGILFIGSSSIRKWTDLEQRFSDKPIIRRGVGGCTIEQLVSYYTPYILYPYHPRKIFIYAGENDIAAGKTGKFTARQFYTLWAMVKQNLPNAEIYYMAIKQSPSRAKYFSEVRIANEMVRNFIKTRKKTHYVDVASVILDPTTKTPDTSLFESDMLHLNSKGYDKWQAVLLPYVK